MPGICPIDMLSLRFGIAAEGSPLCGEAPGTCPTNDLLGSGLPSPEESFEIAGDNPIDTLFLLSIESRSLPIRILENAL